MFETLEVTQDSRGVVTVALNRPDKHNALNARMMDELTQCAERLSADETVRVVVLTGQGKSFCAGGDLGWMRDQMQADDAGRRAADQRIILIFVPVSRRNNGWMIFLNIGREAVNVVWNHRRSSRRGRPG